MSTLCLRFDVDSHRCLGEGVPALLDLLAETDGRATFFVNMGRLTSRSRMVRKQIESRVGSGPPPEPKVTLPLSAKLGRRGMIEVVARNPRVGASMPGAVREIVRAGSEVGLHGGRSHRLWQDDAQGWGRRRIAAEVSWGLARLRDVGGASSPLGFSSPGWTRSSTVDQVLLKAGFSYVADDHGHDKAEVAVDGGLARVPTNLVGEPGGVGYLEWHRALGHGDEEILRDFERRLDSSDGLAVMYDHPFHAGLADLPLLRQLIQLAIADGWELRTLQEVVADAASAGVPSAN